MNKTSTSAMRPVGGLRARIDPQIRQLYPGYSALVMATGIVSNPAFYLGYRALSHFLLAVKVVCVRDLDIAQLSVRLVATSLLQWHSHLAGEQVD